jgi:hypothetical protein
MKGSPETVVSIDSLSRAQPSAQHQGKTKTYVDATVEASRKTSNSGTSPQCGLSGASNRRPKFCGVLLTHYKTIILSPYLSKAGLALVLAAFVHYILSHNAHGYSEHKSKNRPASKCVVASQEEKGQAGCNGSFYVARFDN